MSSTSAAATGHEPEPKVPADFRKALAAAPAAKAKWNALTVVARWDFISWIEQAKQSETRARRIEIACDMLLTGKRRPCCFAVVPFDLHKALTASPKAKATWSDLGSIERRQFIRWIDEEKEREKRQARLTKTCALLAAGKRCP